MNKLYTFASGAQVLARKLSKAEIRRHEAELGKLVRVETVNW